MKQIKAPEVMSEEDNETLKVFLAGSIEQGKAEPWQENLVEEFKDADLLFLNPRRDNWDPSWVNSVDNEQFSTQVNWELDHIDIADVVIFYFDPKTQSSVTLLELGICAALKPNKIVVCCPEGYFRKGNVDIVCERFGIKSVPTIEELYKFLK
jgi:hypothetical protein